MLNLGILILPLGLGIMFFAHGIQHAFGKLGGSGLEGFSKMLSGLGFSPAILWAYLAAYTAFIGGLCLIAGLFTRAASLALLIFIIVAAVKVHLAKKFFIMSGGFEYNFVIACGCLALIFLGAGKFSILDKF